MPATGYIQAYGRIYGRSWTTNRIIELVHERDEARQVACEQYTRANRLEQEKTEWWTKATSRNYEIGRLECERDMLRDALNEVRGRFGWPTFIDRALAQVEGE